MKTDVVVDIKQLRRNVQALPGALPDRVVQYGLKAAANEAAKFAKRPGFAFDDRTGAARKSIAVRMVSKKERRTKTSVSFSGKHLYVKLKIGDPNKAGYAPLLEFGTARMKGRAPIRQAVEETIKQAWRAATIAMQKRYAKLEADAKRGKISRSDLRAALEE